MKRTRLKLFNCILDPLTMSETLCCVECIIRMKKPSQHVVINVAKLILMQKDEKLRNIINSCELINADGQGIVWGAKLLGYNVPERVTGIDLFIKLVSLAAEKGYRLYFLGAKEHVVKRVVESFLSEYPELQIAGFRNGYFNGAEKDQVIDDVARSGADILFLAINSPQKEYFLNENLQKLNVSFVMGVGGSFDVVSGDILRAPLWMQDAGLEWFFRFANEPRRLFKRYLNSNLLFLGMLLRARILGKEKYGCGEEDNSSCWREAELHESCPARQTIKKIKKS